MLKAFREKKLRAALEALPYAREGEFKPGKTIAVGWDNFVKEMERRGRGRPKKAEAEKVEQINIRLKRADIETLRTKRGWQTRLRKYVEEGLATGAL